MVFVKQIAVARSSTPDTLSFSQTMDFSEMQIALILPTSLVFFK